MRATHIKSKPLGTIELERQNTALLEKLRHCDDRSKNRITEILIRQNTPLVESICKEFSVSIPRVVGNEEDLISVGLEGLYRAIKRYDIHKPNRVKFSWYIRTNTLRALRNYRRYHWTCPRQWVEIRDAVKSRADLYQRVTGAQPNESLIAQYSIGLTAEQWDTVVKTYDLAYELDWALSLDEKN